MMSQSVSVMDCIYRACLLVAGLVIAVDCKYRYAIFNMGGVTGNVTFTWNSHTKSYTVVSALSGLQGNYLWAIHDFPMFYNIKSPCSEVGDVYHNFTDEFSENLHPNNQPYSNVSNLSKEIVDRSLVLTLSNQSEKICAHIHQDNGNIMTAVAKFQEPFSGTVMLRQGYGKNQSTTTIFVDLYDTVAPIEPVTYNWRIADLNGHVDFSLSPEMICEQVIAASAFNPTNVQGSCNQSDLSTCAIGDLTGKFTPLTVQPISSLQKYFFNDANLPLSGGNSVVNKILVFENDITTACAYLTELKGKEVNVYIDSDNVRGSFTFRQRSPLDYTNVEINLNNMNNMAGGYHVHEYPVPQRFRDVDQICSDDAVSGHFNPYGILKDSTYPETATTTQDRYELGDLSGKYGLLTGYENVETTHIDWNLPLFGQNSIIGRSVVVHYSSDGSRWVCGTIGYPSKVTTVYGEFQTPVVGSIMFRQVAGDPLSDTSVFIDVAYGNGSPKTYNHNWHIHWQKVGGDMISDTGACQSCEGHANPFGVFLEEYSYCTPEYPMRCEVGDLSGKHGKLTIANSMNTKAGKLFSTDVQLPLSGYATIESMSIVIHDPDSGAPRLGCTNLFKLETKVIGTSTWTAGEATGQMNFRQHSLYDLTKSEIEIQNLRMNAGGYHVHLLPVPMAVDTPCSASSVQGHFNPFKSETPENGTDDMFEVGDLSSKYGSFAGKDSVDAVYYDSNLPLFGPQSIMGRSIVIHRDDESASRWMCSSLEQKLPTDAFSIYVELEFSSNMYTGYVKMKQVHYDNDLLSDTTIELSVSPVANYNNTEVNWMILGTSGHENCGKTAHHHGNDAYNPYDLQILQDEYNIDCGLSSQLRCAVGDLTNKHGLFSTSLSRAIFNDVNLDLAGRAAVIGQNFYLSDANKKQIDCGMLKPTASTGKLTSLTYAHKKMQFDLYDFRETISMNIDSVEMWQIVATLNPVSDEKCSTVEFWILGENHDEVISDIAKAEYETGLGKYSQTKSCNSALCTVSSTCTLIMLIIINLVEIN